MLVEKELVEETPTKATNTWKGSNQNKDAKDKCSTSKKVDALDSYTKYIPIRTTH